MAQCKPIITLRENVACTLWKMRLTSTSCVWNVLKWFMKKCDKYHSLLTLHKYLLTLDKYHECHYNSIDNCQHEIPPSCKTGFHKRVKAFSFMGKLIFPGPRGPQEIGFQYLNQDCTFHLLHSQKLFGKRRAKRFSRNDCKCVKDRMLCWFISGTWSNPIEKICLMDKIDYESFGLLLECSVTFQNFRACLQLLI